jgi:hypothetical protein
MKSGHGSFRTKRTRFGATTCTSFILSLRSLGPAAPVSLERELHVVRRDGIAVVELRVLPDHELVGESVLRERPRLGQARRHDIAGIGFTSAS